jgi:solute carrier family 45 protein 1/2/4
MKDLEAGTPGYESHASPKSVTLQDEGKELKQGNNPSVWLLLAVSLPRMAINMAWSAQWAALGPYLQTMLPSYAVQVTQFIGPIAGILVGPTIGVFSDRSTNRFGRRRPFLAIAAVTSVICWILMGYTREIGDALGDVGDGTAGEVTHRTWTSVFTVIFYLWMDITVNVVQTPAYLLIADFAGERQTMGAALGQGWSTLGSIVVALYIDIFGPAYNSMHWFMGMLSVIMIICVVVACIVARETPLDPSQVDSKTAWEGVVHAFASIWHGIKTLPSVLVVYAIIIVLLEYGYTAYNGSKGQFFGLEVYGGTSDNADSCDPCSEAQNAYNKGVSIAGGRGDLSFNIVGYVFSWCLPFLVRWFGAKWVLTVSCIPQMFLLGMAWCSNVTFDVFVVAICGISQTTMFALLVPAIIHLFGDQVDIGIYVGALNSANCLGQLLEFAMGAAIVGSPLGYKLPVFLGGITSLAGFVVSLFFFKIKMNNM